MSAVWGLHLGCWELSDWILFAGVTLTSGDPKRGPSWGRLWVGAGKSSAKSSAKPYLEVHG